MNVPSAAKVLKHPIIANVGRDFLCTGNVLDNWTKPEMATSTSANTL